MSIENIDIQKYLKKLNFDKVINLTADVLYELQKCHMMRIPFENFDIQNSKPILMDPSYFWDKVVEQNRGGICYELNGLFYELLDTLGFSVSMVSGRVFGRRKVYGEEYDHLALIVEIGGEKFLSDVGFGEFAMKPLRVVQDIEQEDERGLFKIDQFDETYLRVLKKIGEEWAPQYLFTQVKRKLEDFREMFNFHQTDPDSHFMQKRLISKATENGRITISGNLLMVKENGEETKTLIKNEEMFESLLKEHFG